MRKRVDIMRMLKRMIIGAVNGAWYERLLGI